MALIKYQSKDGAEGIVGDAYFEQHPEVGTQVAVQDEDGMWVPTDKGGKPKPATEHK